MSVYGVPQLTKLVIRFGKNPSSTGIRFFLRSGFQDWLKKLKRPIAVIYVKDNFNAPRIEAFHENGGQDKFGRPKAYVHSLKNCDVKEVEKVFGKSRDRIGSASVNLGTKLTSSIQGVWTPAFQRRVQFLLGFHRDPPISHSYPTLENQIINGLKERPELLELFKDQITSIDTVFELPDEIFEALNLKKPDPLA